MIKNIPTTLILMFFYSICIAQTVIKVENAPYKNLSNKIGFMEDKHKNLNFNDIKLLPDTAFSIGTNEIFNGGTTGKIWWLKIQYTHAEDIKPYLVIDYGNIDNIDIYYIDTLNKTKHISSGTFSNLNTRAFLSAEYIFQLPDVSGNPKELYIRASAVNTLILPVKLTTEKYLVNSLLQKYIWQLFYIGIAISLLLFNCFMLVSTKDRLYGLYMIRIFFLFFFYIVLYLNSYANFFNSNVGKIILVHAQAFAAIGYIATIVLNNSFLDIKKHRPLLKKFFDILMLFWFIILILSFWDTREITNRSVHISCITYICSYVLHKH